jgi:S-formylglutathione hydrolase FrmB
MGPPGPVFQPPLRQRELRPGRIRRRRLVAVTALFGALLFALIVAPLAADKVRHLARADPRGAVITDVKIQSKAVGQTLHTTVVVPKGEPAQRRSRTLLVFLHGRGGSDNSFLGHDAMFIALSRLGPRAPIVAFPDGGNHSYWHNRADGDWGDYVTREVIPRVARSVNANPRRAAIGGISMGGFGAYDLVLKHPGRFCAVGGHSPALWRTAGETAPGAFDNARDFARNNVVAAARKGSSAFLRLPVWLDAGAADPFQSGDRAFISGLRSAGARLTVHHSWPGGHNNGYWDKHWLAYFRFYTQALGNCHPGG